MRPTPAEEWQRLTKVYGEMSDGELEEVASDFANLTEIAQPILRDELKKRGMGDPSAATARSDKANDRPNSARSGYAIARRNSMLSQIPSDSSGGSDSGRPGEHVWLTELCSRSTPAEIYQVCEALHAAGIESWTERRGAIFGVQPPGSSGIRVLVADHRLDEARSVIAKEAPQDVIDQSKEMNDNFVPPSCPKCGAADPILESSHPTNSWHCDDCGHDWTEPAPADDSIAKASS
jgi:ribosomal protein L37AE/L43A